MIRKLLYLTIVVRNQNEALDFYTKALGFEKVADYQPEGGPRWLTVSPKGQDIQIALFQAGSYAEGPQARWQPGGDGPSWTFLSDDCRMDYETLKSRGVKFLFEPTEYPWGIGATFSDPDGNKFSLQQSGETAWKAPGEASGEADEPEEPATRPDGSSEPIVRIQQTFSYLSNNWKKRRFLERTWVQRDFKKETGYSVDEMTHELSKMVETSKAGGSLKGSADALTKLSSYYKHLSGLIPEFEHDNKVREGSLEATRSGMEDIGTVLAGVGKR